MKKTYMNPEIEVIELRTKQVLLDSSPFSFVDSPATDTDGFYDDI